MRYGPISRTRYGFRLRLIGLPLAVVLVANSCARQTTTERTEFSERNSGTKTNEQEKKDDKVPPMAGALKLAWLGGNTSKELSNVATWEPDVSKGVGAQSAFVYSTPDCTGEPLKIAKLASPLVKTFFVDTLDDTLVTFQVVTTAEDALQKRSVCSPALRVSRPKEAGSSLAWQQNSPYPGKAIKAIWKKSTEPYLARQTIEIFANSECKNGAVQSNDLPSETESADFNGEFGSSQRIMGQKVRESWDKRSV